MWLARASPERSGAPRRMRGVGPDDRAPGAWHSPLKSTGRDTRSDGGWCRIGRAVPTLSWRFDQAKITVAAELESARPEPGGTWRLPQRLPTAGGSLDYDRRPHDRQPVMASNRRNELIHRLPVKRCQICACTVGLEVHHIRKLADLDPPGRRERPVMRLMAIQHPQDPGDLPPLSRGRPCWKGHQVHPTLITGERTAGKPHAHSETGRRRGPTSNSLAAVFTRKAWGNGAGTTRSPRPPGQLAIQGDLVGRDGPPGTARLTARTRPTNAPGRRSWRRSAARRRPRAPRGCAGGVESR